MRHAQPAADSAAERRLLRRRARSAQRAGSRAPICQAAEVAPQASVIGNRFRKMVPSGKADRAAAAPAEMPGSLVRLAAKPLPPISAAIPANAITSASTRSHCQPFAEQRPGQQRRPHRHGVGDHGGFAGRKPQQRQPHHRHPQRDVQERRNQHAPALISAAPASSGRRKQRVGRQRQPADDAGQPARRQRRPFRQHVFGDRPVQSPGSTEVTRRGIKGPRARSARFARRLILERSFFR